MIRYSKLVVASLLMCVPFALLRAADGELPSNLHWWVAQHTENGQKADFFIVLKQQADVSSAQSLAGKSDKGRFVFSALTRTADEAQAPLRAWLDAQGAKYRPFWIVNAILVEGGDRKLALEAARRPDVERVEGNPVVHNVYPQPEQIEDAGVSLAPRAPEAIEWNISKVNAPGVWALGFHGEGVVVGGQDTGYRWTHVTLKDKYRGWNGVTADHDYNWHDSIHSSTGTCGSNSPVPCDDYGHGTHTMGTVLGDDGGTNQVGMAPGAKWIGCRNMDNGNGTPATYLECFQFFLAPTKLDGSSPDPTKAPDVTNNSWGCPTSEGCSWDTLQTAVDNQKAAGIMTVVSAGNSGSSCNTVTDPPAIYASSYSVGSTTSSDAMSSFSSRGYATGTNLMKPNIVAPGSGVRSAYNSSDTAYTSMSGTSMAGPHVAGAVALLWSARACFLNWQDATETVLNNSSLDLPSIVESCGGNYVTGPNNTWGNGRLDILAAVNAGCPCTTPGVPAIGSASVPADNQLAVSWTPGSPAGNTYNVYRSMGACPGGTFTRVRSGQASSPWTDTTVSGGTTYSYKVTAVDSTGGCESAQSGCVSATATGACTLAPTFAGLASVTNPAGATCSLNLSWAAGDGELLGAGAVQDLPLHDDPRPARPGEPHRLGSERHHLLRRRGPGERDDLLLRRAVRRSFERLGGREHRGRERHPHGRRVLADPDRHVRGGGRLRPGRMDLQHPERVRELGVVHRPGPDPDPLMVRAGRWHAPATRSWSARPSGPWRTPPSPSTTSTRSRAPRRATTAGTLEYAVGPGYGTWTVVPDAWFTTGGFNGTVSTCCSNPIAGKRAWCFSLPSWTQVSLGLSAVSGQSVKLRWHEGDDSSVSATGWYVDSVAIANAGTAAPCATGNPAPPPVASSGASGARFSKGPGNILDVTYDAATCSAQKLIILYNTLGAWSGYSGCAQANGGNGGVTTVDSTGQTNVWYNLVWTNGTTAGHPGFATSGARAWNAGTLCGMTSDDHTVSTCP